MEILKRYGPYVIVAAIVIAIAVMLFASRRTPAPPATADAPAVEPAASP